MLLHVQGHIWRTGFQSNELVGVVFDDVAEALERWHASGIKVYVPFTQCFLLLASLGQLHSYWWSVSWNFWASAPPKDVTFKVITFSYPTQWFLQFLNKLKHHTKSSIVRIPFFFCVIVLYGCFLTPLMIINYISPLIYLFRFKEPKTVLGFEVK